MTRWAAVFAFSMVCGVAVAQISPTSLSDAIQLKVEKYQLNNGLTVLLVEDHSAPFFTFQQWFRVGSKNEKLGRSGLAHFFEHYMFKGTKKYPFPSFEKVVAANGGTFNAFTTRDYTGYFENFPAGKLELAVSLESDRMRNLVFDQSKVNSEREVVKEERRMRYDNDVFGTLNEKLWKSVFKVHPYGWPVIGYMTDLNRATLDDLKEFYRVNYAPNNAIVLVVGDFSTKQAKTLIDKYYGGIPSQTIPPFKPFQEPEQQGERQVKVDRDVQNVTMGIGFPIAKAGTPDVYPLDLIATILGDGQSSRLYRKLVYDQQVATGVSVGSSTGQDAGLFAITVSLKPGQDPDKVLQTIYAEIFKLRSHPVTDAELEKAKNIVMKDFVDGLKTNYGKAHSLAIHELYFGDYSEMFKELERYNGVTKQAIMTATEKYFRPSSRTVIRIEPVSKSDVETKSASPGEAGAESEGAGG